MTNESRSQTRGRFSRVPAIAAGAVLACVLAGMVVPAHAFVFAVNGLCTRMTWPTGANSVRELRCSSAGFPGLPNSSDPGSTFTDARNSMFDGYSMWVRDGSSRSSLVVNPTTCFTGAENGAWFDNGNELSEAWYETQAVTTSLCGGAAIGCTEQDTVDSTCLFGGNAAMIAADISIANDFAWSVVNQQNLAECIAFGGAFSVEWVWMHEVGHAYGLGHQNGLMAVMNDDGTRGHHNCHVARGFNDYPHADDIAGLMARHQGFTGPRFNLTGTPWFVSGGNAVLTNQLRLVSATGTASVSGAVTIESHFTNPVNFDIRVVLIRSDLTPVFSSTTSTWSYTNSGTVFATNASAPGRSQTTLSFVGSAAGNVLTAGLTYRAWVHIDSLGASSESDEGDNIFPTNIRVQRL